jgi:hypothetical protein
VFSFIFLYVICVLLFFLVCDLCSPLSAQRGYHRVPVVNDEGKIVNIVSQSTVVQHLHNHMAEVGEAGKVRVRVRIHSRSSRSLCAPDGEGKVAIAIMISDATVHFGGYC